MTIERPEPPTWLPRSTVNYWRSRDQFPQPLKIGPSAIAWQPTDFDAWLAYCDRAASVKVSANLDDLQLDLPLPCGESQLITENGPAHMPLETKKQNSPSPSPEIYTQVTPQTTSPKQIVEAIAKAVKAAGIEANVFEGKRPLTPVELGRQIPPVQEWLVEGWIPTNATTGIFGAAGNGYSGSTAWNAAVRARLEIQADPDVGDMRKLFLPKSNYAPADDSGIPLVMENGAFVPLAVPGIDTAKGITSLIVELVAAGERSGQLLQDAAKHPFGLVDVCLKSDVFTSRPKHQILAVLKSVIRAAREGSGPLRIQKASAAKDTPSGFVLSKDKKAQLGGDV